MSNRRLVLVGRKATESGTLHLNYDNRHAWGSGPVVSGNADPEPDHDLLRKRKIEQDIADGVGA